MHYFGKLAAWESQEVLNLSRNRNKFPWQSCVAEDLGLNPLLPELQAKGELTSPTYSIIKSPSFKAWLVNNPNPLGPARLCKNINVIVCLRDLRYSRERNAVRDLSQEKAACSWPITLLLISKADHSSGPLMCRSTGQRWTVNEIVMVSFQGHHVYPTGGLITDSLAQKPQKVHELHLMVLLVPDSIAEAKAQDTGWFKHWRLRSGKMTYMLYVGILLLCELNVAAQVPTRTVLLHEFQSVSASAGWSNWLIQPYSA